MKSVLVKSLLFFVLGNLLGAERLVAEVALSSSSDSAVLQGSHDAGEIASHSDCSSSDCDDESCANHRCHLGHCSFSIPAKADLISWFPLAIQVALPRHRYAVQIGHMLDLMRPPSV